MQRISFRVREVISQKNRIAIVSPKGVRLDLDSPDGIQHFTTQRTYFSEMLFQLTLDSTCAVTVFPCLQVHIGRIVLVWANSHRAKRADNEESNHKATLPRRSPNTSTFSGKIYGLQFRYVQFYFFFFLKVHCTSQQCRTYHELGDHMHHAVSARLQED